VNIEQHSKQVVWKIETHYSFNISVCELTTDEFIMFFIVRMAPIFFMAENEEITESFHSFHVLFVALV
jgi:hypothetical protein